MILRNGLKIPFASQQGPVAEAYGLAIAAQFARLDDKPHLLPPWWDAVAKEEHHGNEYYEAPPHVIAFVQDLARRLFTFMEFKMGYFFLNGTLYSVARDGKLDS